MALILPEDFTEVKSLEDLKKANYPAIWPCIEPKNFPRCNIHAVGPGATSGAWEDETFQRDAEYQGNGWAIAKLTDVFIREEIVMDRNGNIFGMGPWWRLCEKIWYFDRADREGTEKRLRDYLAQRIDRPLKEISTPCTFFYQAPHGHWLYEALLPMSVWQKIGWFPDFLSVDPCASYRKQFLDMLGFPEEKRLFENRDNNDFHCQEMWFLVPWRNFKTTMTPLHEGWTPDGWRCYGGNHLWWLNTSSITMDFTRGIGAIANSQLGRGDRIFIGREGTALHRMCLNERQAWHVAEKYGFVYVNPAELSGEEEAAVFHQAKVICGSSGGGIHNVVFCQQGTKIICLGPEDDVSWPLFAIATVNKLKMVTFHGPMFDSLDKNYNGPLSPYVLDLVLFKEYLKNLQS